MKSETEIKKLYNLIKWYFDSPRIQRQDHETKNNFIGIDVTLGWLTGEDRHAENLIEQTIKDIQTMQRIDNPERN